MRLFRVSGRRAHPCAVASGSKPSVRCRGVEQPEGVSVAWRSDATGLVGVGQVAEDEWRGWGRLPRRPGCSPTGAVSSLPLGRGFLPRGMQPAVAEVALLDHAAHTRGDVGIQRFFHSCGPLGIPPVEVPGVIGAGRHAVPAAEAALRDLADDARRRIDLHGILRADGDARAFRVSHCWHIIGTKAVSVPGRSRSRASRRASR